MDFSDRLLARVMMKYKHTNIVARDWRALAGFYENALGCVRVPPERRLSGPWLEKVTGVRSASLSGAHLRLPGFGEDGPTLEIFQYSHNESKLPPAANREGFSHLAFEVDDVGQAMAEVLEKGGGRIGEVSTTRVEGVGTLTVVYVSDPEGNIIELQSWT
jgi:catechol 2,3-dioxygenase-like lactoylglutathione lyase family enzyme